MSFLEDGDAHTSSRLGRPSQQTISAKFQWLHVRQCRRLGLTLKCSAAIHIGAEPRSRSYWAVSSTIQHCGAGNCNVSQCAPSPLRKSMVGRHMKPRALIRARARPLIEQRDQGEVQAQGMAHLRICTIDQKGGISAPPSFSSGKCEGHVPSWASLRNQLSTGLTSAAALEPCFARPTAADTWQVKVDA